MSALTDRRKREIEMLYRKMKEKPSRVFMYIFLDESMLREEKSLHTYISKLMREIKGIESYKYSEATNYITAIAQCPESTAEYLVEYLRTTPGIKSVEAKILYPARD